MTMKNERNPVEELRRQEKAKLKKKQAAQKAANKRSFEETDHAGRTPKTNNGGPHTPKYPEQLNLQQRLGPKSIFYDPEWNPYGETPEKYASKYPNLYYNPKKFSPNSVATSTAESKLLEQTEVPKGDPPRFYKRTETSSVSYEGEEKLSSLVPTALLRKKPKYT